MSVSQNINPMLCSAWLHDVLSESDYLQSRFGRNGVLRAYQDVAVPTPDEGLVYPYIYWSGGQIDHAAFYDKERETWGRCTSRYVVRAVQEFHGRADWAYFIPIFQEFRRVLTGIRAVDVLVDNQKIGSVWSSRFIDPYALENRDGEVRILESGLLIEISHL